MTYRKQVLVNHDDSQDDQYDNQNYEIAELKHESSEFEPKCDSNEYDDEETVLDDVLVKQEIADAVCDAPNEIPLVSVDVSDNRANNCVEIEEKHAEVDQPKDSNVEEMPSREFVDESSHTVGNGADLMQTSDQVQDDRELCPQASERIQNNFGDFMQADVPPQNNEDSVNADEQTPTLDNGDASDVQKITEPDDVGVDETVEETPATTAEESPEDARLDKRDEVCNDDDDGEEEEACIPQPLCPPEPDDTGRESNHAEDEERDDEHESESRNDEDRDNGAEAERTAAIESHDDVRRDEPEEVCNNDDDGEEEEACIPQPLCPPEPVDIGREFDHVEDEEQDVEPEGESRNKEECDDVAQAECDADEDEELENQRTDDDNRAVDKNVDGAVVQEEVRSDEMRNDEVSTDEIPTDEEPAGEVLGHGDNVRDREVDEAEGAGDGTCADDGDRDEDRDVEAVNELRNVDVIRDCAHEDDAQGDEERTQNQVKQVKTEQFCGDCYTS
jgi:hypothetical protein